MKESPTTNIIKCINMKKLIIEASVENLDTVQDFIAGELKEFNYSMKLQAQIALATEEVFVNIAQYAYIQDTCVVNSQNELTTPNIMDVVIRVIAGDEIIIEFEDGGKPYNPLENSNPDIKLSAEERRIGGLGFFLVKNLVDTVNYQYRDNKNILMIKKKVK